MSSRKHVFNDTLRLGAQINGRVAPALREIRSIDHASGTSWLKLHIRRLMCAHLAHTGHHGVATPTLHTDVQWWRVASINKATSDVQGVNVYTLRQDQVGRVSRRHRAAGHATAQRWSVLTAGTGDVGKRVSHGCGRVQWRRRRSAARLQWSWRKGHPEAAGGERTIGGQDTLTVGRQTRGTNNAAGAVSVATAH